MGILVQESGRTLSLTAGPGVVAVQRSHSEAGEGEGVYIRYGTGVYPIGGAKLIYKD